MKKVIFSALTFCMLSTVAVFGQDVDQEVPATTQEQENSGIMQDHESPAADVSDEMRTEVALDELPEAVNSKLQSEDYQEWNPTASYLVKDENETEHYVVELEKEGENKTATFDAQGNLVPEENEEELEK